MSVMVHGGRVLLAKNESVNCTSLIWLNIKSYIFGPAVHWIQLDCFHLTQLLRKMFYLCVREFLLKWK